MSEERVLTKEIAERFLHDEESVDLGEYTYVELAAAEVLSGHEMGIHLLNLIPQVPTEFEKIQANKRAELRSIREELVRLEQSRELNESEKRHLDWMRRRNLGVVPEKEIFNIG